MTDLDEQQPGNPTVELELGGEVIVLDLSTLGVLIRCGRLGPDQRVRCRVDEPFRPIGSTELWQELISSQHQDRTHRLPQGLRLLQALRVKPVVTICLVLVNLLAWTALELLYSSQDPLTLLLLGAKTGALVSEGQIWRLCTAVFLHAGPLHLLVNMVAVYVLGRFIEMAWGRMSFLAIYLLAGVGGTVLSHLCSDETSVGASGAILGLLGASVIFAIKHRRGMPVVSKHFVLLVLVVLTGATVALGFLQPNVDNYAHLGGLIIGSIVAAGLPTAISESASRPGARRASAALCIAVVLCYVTSIMFAVHNVWTSEFVRTAYQRKVYSSSKGLFQFSYPARWQIRHQQEQSVEISDELGSAYLVAAAQAAEPVAATDPSSGAFDSVDERHEVVEAATVSVNRQPATRLVLLVQKGDRLQRRVVHIFARSGLEIALILGAPDRYFTRYQHIFSDIVNSFRITAPD